jgi:hypothetical protein
MKDQHKHYRRRSHYIQAKNLLLLIDRSELPAKQPKYLAA